MYILCFLLLLVKSLTAPYEFKITKTIYNTLRISAIIGHPGIEVELAVIFSEANLGLSNNMNYNESYSDTISDLVYLYKKIEFKENVGFRDMKNELVTVASLPMTKFSYNINHKGFFGLGEKIGLEKEAHLYYILNSKLGNSKQVFYLNYNKLKIGFGEYPNEYYQLKNKYKFCKMVNASYITNQKENIGYYCKFDMIYFKDSQNNAYHYYFIDTIVRFCPSSNAFFVPESFLNFLADTYFKEAIESNFCKKVKGELDYKYVKCNNNFDYRKLPKWTILFEKFSLKLDPEDLFTFVEGNLFVLIASSPNRNLFHFGYPILNKFITIIDNDKKEIGFINHQGI